MIWLHKIYICIDILKILYVIVNGQISTIIIRFIAAEQLFSDLWPLKNVKNWFPWLMIFIQYLNEIYVIVLWLVSKSSIWKIPFMPLI